MKELAVYLTALKALADAKHDGHYTIMKFTTNYRVCFGTPTTEEDIQMMAEGPTLLEAIKNLFNDLMEEEYGNR